jgi:hypothetical protein
MIYRRLAPGNFDFMNFSACDVSGNGIEDPQFGTDADGVAPQPISAERPVAGTQDGIMSFRTVIPSRPTCNSSARRWAQAQ